MLEENLLSVHEIAKSCVLTFLVLEEVLNLLSSEPAILIIILWLVHWIVWIKGKFNLKLEF